MSDVWVLQNQNGQYWGKSQEWIEGSENQQIKKFTYHDQALNELFELNAKDVTLRGKVLGVDVDEKGRPLVEVRPPVRAFLSDLS